MNNPGTEEKGTVTFTGNGTAAGEHSITITAAETDNYEETTITETLTINKRPVTVTAGSYSVVYDPNRKGTTDSEQYTISTATPLATGDALSQITCASTGTVGSYTVGSTHANKITNVVIRNASNQDVTSSYELTEVDGEITVTKETEPTVSASNLIVAYDGKTHLVTGSTTNTDTGAVIKYSYRKSGTSDSFVETTNGPYLAGTYEIKMYVAATANYEACSGIATLTISKRALEITAKSKTENYSGFEITVSGAAIAGSGTLADGDTLSGLDSVTLTNGTRTDAGEYTTSVPASSIQIKRDEEDVTDCYEITYKTGTLKVNKVSDKFTNVKNKELNKTYDGTPVDAEAVQNSAQGPWFTTEESGTYTYAYYNEKKDTLENPPTDAGTYYVRVTKSETTNYLETTSELYAFVIKKAAYEGAEVTEQEETYDGTQKVFKNYHPSNAEVEIKYKKCDETTQKTTEPYRAGQYTVSVKFSDQNHVKNCVTQLNIEKKPLKLNALSEEKTYDGDPLTAGYEFAGNTGLADGDEIQVTMNGSQTKVGSSENTITSIMIMRGTVDVTDCYDYEIESFGKGTLTVKPVAADITAEEQQTFMYNGQPQKIQASTNLDCTLEYRLKTEGATESYTSNFTGPYKAGTYTIQIRVPATAHYAEAAKEVQLTIQPKALTVTAGSDSVVYDDQSHSTGYTSEGLVTGDAISACTVTGTLTDIGTVETSASGVTILRSGEDVTSCYQITYKSGTLEVTPKSDTITVDGSKINKNYDGSPVNPDTVTESWITRSGSGTLSYKFFRKTGENSYEELSTAPTAAGTYYVKVQEAAAGNYSASESDYAEFCISKKVAAITVSEKTVTYDGAVHMIEQPTINDGRSSSDYAITYKKGDEPFTGAFRAGTYEITVTVADKTGNYEDWSDSVTLKIDTVAITVKAKSATRSYSPTMGTFMIPKGYELAGGTLVKGDSISVENTGSLSQAGTVENVLNQVTITSSQRGDVTDCYDITKENGTLTVSRISDTIIADGSKLSRLYNGQVIDPTEFSENEWITRSGNGTLTYAYFKDEGGNNYTALSSAPKDAGSYAVQIIEAESTNYLAAVSDYIPFTISQSEQTGIDVSGKTVTYDGNDHMIDAAVCAEGSTVSCTVNGETFDGARNAGTYNITVIVTHPNYKTWSKTVELVIEKAKPKFTLKDEKIIRSYNAKPQALQKEEFDTDSDGENITYTYIAGGETKTEATECGTYRLTVTIAETENYQAASTEVIMDIISHSRKKVVTEEKPEETPEPIYINDELSYQPTGEPQTMEELNSEISMALRGVETPKNTGVSRYLNTEEHIVYINGYADGTVQAEQNVTRAEVFMMFYRLLLKPERNHTMQFSDVDPDAWFATPTLTLAEMGVLNGYGDGSIHPNDYITREEFIVIAMRFAVKAEGNSVFADVSEDEWGKDAISVAADYGWIKGYGDNTFRPKVNITRASAATVINRMLYREADVAALNQNHSLAERFSDLLDSSVWYYGDIMEAAGEHDFEIVDYNECWKSTASVQ